MPDAGASVVHAFDKERERALAEEEFYMIAARLFRAGIGLYAVAGLMWAAFARLQADALEPPSGSGRVGARRG